jgi:hypothetical protein
MKPFSTVKKLTSVFVALILTVGTGITLTACGDQNSGTAGPESGTPIIYQLGESPSLFTYILVNDPETGARWRSTTGDGKFPATRSGTNTDSSDTNAADTGNKHFRVMLSNATFGPNFGASDIVVTTNYGDFQVTDIKITDPSDSVLANTEAVVTAQFPGELPEQYSYTLKLDSQVVDTAGNPVNYLQYNTSDFGTGEEQSRWYPTKICHGDVTQCRPNSRGFFKRSMKRTAGTKSGSSASGTSSAEAASDEANYSKGDSIIFEAIDKITAEVQNAEAGKKPVFVTQFVDDISSMVHHTQLLLAEVETKTDALAEVSSSLGNSLKQFQQALTDNGYIVSEGIVKPETAETPSDIMYNFALPTDVERTSVEEATDSGCLEDETGSYDLLCGDLTNLGDLPSDSPIEEVIRALNTEVNDYEVIYFANAPEDATKGGFCGRQFCPIRSSRVSYCGEKFCHNPV